jgi:hypothetical protein
MNATQSTALVAIRTTATATFWARLPLGAENIKARPEGCKHEVSWTVNGKRASGFVEARATQSPEQMRALLAIR